MRCEAGAWYDQRGKVHHECFRDATYQVAVDGQELLVVWCNEHAADHASDLLVGWGPRIRLEPIRGTDARKENEGDQAAGDV